MMDYLLVNLQSDDLERASQIPLLASRFVMKDGLLYYLSKAESTDSADLRLYIPESLRHSYMVAFHDSAGHLGVERMYVYVQAPEGFVSSRFIRFMYNLRFDRQNWIPLSRQGRGIIVWGRKQQETTCKAMMTDPPTDDTEAREPDAPDPTDAKHHTPLHGHTGGVPSDKALSDSISAVFALPRRLLG
eukprot:scaffold7099_cov131-Isochrysis_galbana.AAC.6